MFGRDHLQCSVVDGRDRVSCLAAGQGTRSLARTIEFYLKKRVWAAEHIPDDHVVWPALPVPAVYAENHQRWGVALAWQDTGDELGSRTIIAPFREEIDLSRLRPPQTDVDEAATAARLEQAAELVGGRLVVYPAYETLGESPFEFAVRLRGMEQIFFDVYDRPELVHAMMEFITQSIIADHQQRELHGWTNSPPDPSGRYQMVPTWRHISAYLQPDWVERGPRLCDEWAYVSAQSATGLGPRMYEEFVHPYNCRIAELFSAQTVYYHGCECLDQKLDIIATLPNLRRFHVSPWSSVALAARKFQGSALLEVHANPTLIALGATRDEMHKVIRGLVDAADGHPMNLCLTDIHNLGGNPDSLRTWAEVAQEAAR
jgi:hypothetical protein